MKKNFWKHILTIAVLGVGVFAAIEIYKAWQAGKRAIKDLLLAPWYALSAGWSVASSAASTVASNAAAAAALPALTSTELSNAQDQTSTAATYQPGGAMYNTILATQGQAAADKAAAQAQANADIQLAQANSDSSFFGFGNLLDYL